MAIATCAFCTYAGVAIHIQHQNFLSSYGQIDNLHSNFHNSSTKSKYLKKIQYSRRNMNIILTISILINVIIVLLFTYYTKKYGTPLLKKRGIKILNMKLFSDQFLNAPRIPLLFKE